MGKKAKQLSYAEDIKDFITMVNPRVDGELIIGQRNDTELILGDGDKVVSLYVKHDSFTSSLGHAGSLSDSLMIQLENDMIDYFKGESK